MKKTGIGSLLAILVVALLFQVVQTAQNQAPANDPIRPEKIQMHEKFGTAEIFSGSFTIQEAASRQERAHAFIAARQENFKMQQPSEELELIKEETDRLGLTHLRFQQKYEGLRVWGCQTIVHFKGENTIYLVGGQTIPTPTFSAVPVVSAEGAVEQALADLKAELTGSGYESDAELIVYPNKGDPKLAQLVTITHPNDGAVRWLVFVDAQTGEVLAKLNNIHFEGPDIGTGPDTRDSMRTFDIYGSGGIYQMINTIHTGNITTYDDYYGGGPISTDPDGDKVWDDNVRQKAEVAGHYYANKAYEYFLNTHGRDSYDGLGHNLRVNVHDPRYVNNAYWNGYGINFADGDGTNWLPWSGSLDVVTHEYTHAVTEYTADLIYWFQSGALSEHFSDAFGAMVDRDDWTMGEEIGLVGNIVRNLQNPNATGHPKDMSDYRNLPYETDNGGVHINCGIPNHAFYKTCTLIGKDKAELIWYRTLSTYLTPNSGFYFWAGMTMQSTIDLYGAGSPEVSNVELGLIWVNLGTAYAMPEIVEIGASSGQIANLSMWVYNPGTSTGSLSAAAVAPTIPYLTMVPGTGYQDPIPDGDSSEFVLSYDATSLGDCNIGIFRDTLRFDVVGPYVTTYIKLPLTAGMGLTTSSRETETFSAVCLTTTATNTSNVYQISYGGDDDLYSASLLIGLIDGDDTTVYRDIFGTQTFAPIDTVKTESGQVWFTTASEDGRIRADVTYSYGSENPDHCGFIIADYALYNICDTPFTVLSGLVADFDVWDGGSNVAGYDETNEMVYMKDVWDNRGAGLALLSGPARNLRAIHNPTYGGGGAFTDGVAYSQMAMSTNNEGTTSDDYSILLTFGEGQLGSEDTLRYQVAWLYSPWGPDYLPGILDFARAWLGPQYLCGDADNSGTINLLDATFLINYLYKDGPAPEYPGAGDPDASGATNLLDVTYIINYLYKEGPEPLCP